MNWFHSIFIGLLTGLVGLFSAGFVANLNVRWYRISSFEGLSGYYVVFIALAGGLVGLIVGIVCARIVAGWTDPNFVKGVGLAFGSMVGLVFVIGMICWLAADLPPTIGGKSLELAIEVRAPQGFKMPVELDDWCTRPYVDVLRVKSQSTTELRLNEATQVDGRWIIPATMAPQTSLSNKDLRAYFNETNKGFFPLALRPHPQQKDFEWSQWIESAAWNANQPRPAPEDAFFLRYKLQIEPPPP